MKMVRSLSLRARALSYLARREHSRLELQRKLQPHAESQEQLAALLDQLEHEQLLSHARFAESLIHRKSPRYGAQRILADMKQQGLEENLIRQAEADLTHTELERTRAVWARRFNSPPKTWAEKAKQANFLRQRGFAMAVIRSVLQTAQADQADILDELDDFLNGPDD